MRAVVQRVAEASVRVEGDVIGAIGPGLLVLLGIAHGDGDVEAAWLAAKLARLRIFEDETGRMGRSLLDTGGDALVVSQFTLLGSLKKGTRPDFTAAARPEAAEPLYRRFVAALAETLDRPVAQGRFGAMMAVSLVNDGPVTLVVDSPAGGSD